MFYDEYEVKHMMNKCSKCTRYNWDKQHTCYDSFTPFKVGRHEIYCDTIGLCNEIGGYNPKIENWWMMK